MVLETAAKSKSTRVNKTRAMNLYNGFLADMPNDENQDAKIRLCQFIAWMSLHGYRAATIKTYLALVRKHIKYVPQGSEASDINSLVKGAYCLQAEKVFRKPLSRSMLRTLLDRMGAIAKSIFEA